MTIKPPETSRRRAPENPHLALEYEIAREKASALGRLGRRLEKALAALNEFDQRHGSAWQTDPELLRARRALAAQGGVALWHFIVQREAVGLRDATRVLRDYRVPPEVRDRMAAFPVPW
jgi:hypothetical protein